MQRRMLLRMHGRASLTGVDRQRLSETIETCLSDDLIDPRAKLNKPNICSQQIVAAVCFVQGAAKK